jgi:chemotaxis protein histidine kinase CheA
VTALRPVLTYSRRAGFLKLEALRDLAHDLESLLDAGRRSELRITSEIIDLILSGAGAPKHFTREIGAQLQGANPGARILVPTRQIIGRVQSALRSEPPPAAAPPHAEDGIIVVAESGDSARGLLVDELIGKQEVVIKSLSGAFEQQNQLAGGAVLGDGSVGLILDVDTLVKIALPTTDGTGPASTSLL